MTVLHECLDNDSPWLICKHCGAVGRCEKDASQRPARIDAPIGYLTRFRSQVEDAERFFPGESHDHLWSYTHGTKKMEHFAAFPDMEVVPVYATPQPANGLTVRADADGVWLAFAASTGLHALLHVERIADSHGGIVSKALRDWAADVGNPRGA